MTAKESSQARIALGNNPLDEVVRLAEEAGLYDLNLSDNPLVKEFRPDTIRACVRHLCKKLGSKRATAAAIGISPRHLERVRRSEAALPRRVMDYFGLEEGTVYRRRGGV